MKTRQSGFTVIEVMIAAIIIVALAAIALPAYQESVKRSRRAEVKTAMYGLAQALERYYTNNNTYQGAAVNGANPIFPQNVPSTGEINYTLQLAIMADPATPTAAGSSYQITAVRAGSQTTDKCGDFTLTASGLRGVINASETAEKCWD